MIIEFFGVPGGGKTQILRQLVIIMPDAVEARPMTRTAIILWASYFVLRHPLSSFVWMVELLLHSNGMLRYKFVLLIRSMSARAMAERSRASFVFVDEGLLQRLLTIFDEPLSPRHIGFLISMTPLSDAVVVVKGGEFGRFTVAHNRFDSPRVKVGEERLQKWMENVRMNARSVQNALQHHIRIVECTRGEPDAEPGAVRTSLLLGMAPSGRVVS